MSNRKKNWIVAMLEAPLTESVNTDDLVDAAILVHDKNRVIWRRTQDEKNALVATTRKYLFYLWDFEDLIDYSTVNFDIALDEKRHTQFPYQDEFSRMSDAQLLVDAVLAKRRIRVTDIKIEMHLRQEVKQDKARMDWFKANFKDTLLGNDYDLQYEMATLMGNYEEFETWVYAEWTRLELDSKTREDVLTKIIKIAHRVIG